MCQDSIPIGDHQNWNESGQKGATEEVVEEWACDGGYGFEWASWYDESSDGKDLGVAWSMKVIQVAYEKPTFQS